MKKIRITINKGATEKKFPVFNSPESLYVWLHDPVLQNNNRVDPDLGSIILLRPDEIMEIEWMGCEYIDDDHRILRVDQIRLAKTMKTKSSSLDNIIGVYSGWTIEDTISFKGGITADIRRSRLTPKSKHKFDIGELFAARDTQEKKDNHKIDPANLH